MCRGASSRIGEVIALANVSISILPPTYLGNPPHMRQLKTGVPMKKREVCSLTCPAVDEVPRLRSCHPVNEFLNPIRRAEAP